MSVEIKGNNEEFICEIVDLVRCYDCNEIIIWVLENCLVMKKCKVVNFEMFLFFMIS